MNKLIHHKQLGQLISAHFKEIVRQPAVIFWGIIFPILMALGLGIAFTQTSDIVRHVAVIENDSAISGNTKTKLLIQTFLENHADKIKPAKDQSPQYKITLPDKKLGNTTFIFEKTDWHQALVLLKRGNLSIIMDEKKRAD